MKKYKYVGPEEIRKAIADFPPGTPIKSSNDLSLWLKANEQETNWLNLIWATFVIDLSGCLLLASRNSEHVACAGGEMVLSAGEIAFDPKNLSIEEITNQSTGYCPEPNSWPVIEKVLDDIGIDHPDDFTTSYEFRKCLACGERNVVKDQVFECLLCGAELSFEWNFQ